MVSFCTNTWVITSLIWLIHSNTDLTHIVKAKSTAVSANAMKEYRGVDVQLYSFLSLAVERCKLSASYVSSGKQPSIPHEQEAGLASEPVWIIRRR
jgi:hypothetical protein